MPDGVEACGDAFPLCQPPMVCIREPGHDRPHRSRTGTTWWNVHVVEATPRRAYPVAWITGPTVRGMRSAIGAWLAALFIGIITYLFLGDVPKIGSLLETLGWIAVIALVIYGLYAMFAGRRGHHV